MLRKHNVFSQSNKNLFLSGRNEEVIVLTLHNRWGIIGS